MKKYLSIFLLFGFSYTQNNNFIYLKLGLGTTDNDMTNIEFSSNPQPDIQSEELKDMLKLDLKEACLIIQDIDYMLVLMLEKTGMVLELNMEFHPMVQA